MSADPHVAVVVGEDTDDEVTVAVATLNCDFYVTVGLTGHGDDKVYLPSVKARELARVLEQFADARDACEARVRDTVVRLAGGG